MRAVLAIILSLAAWQTTPTRTQPTQAQKRPTSVFAWICSKLGVSLDVYNKLQGVRGSATERNGRFVMALDLAAGDERVVAECASCRSPQPVPGDGILVVKNDGVWTIGDDRAPARLVFRQQDVRGILGVPDAQPRQALIAMDRPGQNGCDVRVLDLDRGTTEPGQLDDRPCRQLLSVRVLGRVNGLRVLGETDRVSSQLEIETAPSLDQVGAIGMQPILIKHPAPEADGKYRFDPVWLAKDHNVLIYLVG